jgi:hypothetical protein
MLMLGFKGGITSLISARSIILGNSMLRRC